MELKYSIVCNLQLVDENSQSAHISHVLSWCLGDAIEILTTRSTYTVSKIPYGSTSYGTHSRHQMRLFS